MASRFWVGGTGTWDNSTTTHWAATSNGAGGQSVPGAADTVTFDASSGGGKITLNYSPTVISITGGAHTGEFDTGNQAISVATFSYTGSGTRTLTLGSSTITCTGNNATIVTLAAVTNLTLTANTATFDLTYSGATGTRIITTGAIAEASAFSVKVSAGTDTVNINVIGGMNLDTTGFTGTFTGTSNRTFYGNVTMPTGTISGTSTLTLGATSGTKTINIGIANFDNLITINGIGGTFQLGAGLTIGTTRAFAITNGTFDINGQALSVGILTLNTGTKTLADVVTGGSISITGSETTVLTLTSTNTTYTTIPTINLTYAGSTGTRTIIIAATSVVTDVTAGSDALSYGTATLTTFDSTIMSGWTGTSLTIGGALTVGSFDISGTSTTTLAGIATISCSGSVRGKSGITNNYTGLIIMTATSGTKTIRSDTMTWGSAFTLNGSGGTFQLYDDFTTAVAKTFTITAGTFDINGKAFSTGIISCNSVTATFADVATGGSVTITGNNGTVINMATLTNVTITTLPKFVCNYSGATGTRTISVGATGGSATKSIDLDITGGTDALTLSTGSVFKSLNLTGYRGTKSNTTSTFYGSVTIDGGTFTAGANIWTFAATSGTMTLTSSVTLDFPITLNGSGGTLQLGGNVALGATRAFTFTAGTFNMNNYNFNALSMSIANTVGNTITLGSGTLTLTGTGTVWSVVGTNVTVNCNTSTIKITDSATATQCTFAGAGKTYYKVWLSRGTSTQNFTISGSNTFYELKDDGTAAHSVITTVGTTQRFTVFNVNGTSGNLITLNSTTTGSYTFIKDGPGMVVCNYLDIYHCIATPAIPTGNYGLLATWNAVNSTSHQSTTTAGSGWFFGDPKRPLPVNIY